MGYRFEVSVRVEKTDLPGIGVRHDVLTATGRRISVVFDRNGERNLAVYDRFDPDACRDSIPLTDDEASVLSDLLGGTVMLSQLSGLTSETTGVFTEHLLLPADSPYLGRTLGSTQARTRTGVSIVAIVRGAEVIASPTPSALFDAGDILVAVGTRAGLDALTQLLSRDIL